MRKQKINQQKRNKDMLGLEETHCPKCLRKTKSIWKDGVLYCLVCEGIKK
jgi:hypothetical protein